jgi:hypothetical protein
LLERLDVTRAGFVSEAERAVTSPSTAAAVEEAPPPPRYTPRHPGVPPLPRSYPAEAPGEGRGRGRPVRHEEPVQQTTIRLTRGEWAALQAQVTKETLERGERRYVTDIVRDAVAEYLARRG